MKILLHRFHLVVVVLQFLDAVDPFFAFHLKRAFDEPPDQFNRLVGPLAIAFV